MFTDAQLDEYYIRENLSLTARKIIERIRKSPPSRRVKSSKKSMSCRYPSKKMMVVIQAESHTNELAALYEWDHDDVTFEFYDQPGSIRLRYKKQGGSGNVVVDHTPDYFVLRQGYTGWEECKTEEHLQKLAKTMPYRYQLDENGVWRCPPGEAYAAEHALQRCAENCLHYRKTKVLLIDEASVMLLKAKGTPPVHLFEAIKSLSGNSGVKIVLVGTYQLLEIMEQSAQLIRRSRVVHMARYSNGFKKDQDVFKNILRSFQAQMPIANLPDLDKHAEAFYLKSVGCIGILHSLLLAWFEHALKTGETGIEEAFLDGLIPNFSVMQVLEEAFAGELKLRDVPLDLIKKMLEDHNKGLQLPDTAKKVEKPKGKAGKNQNEVGKRNPKRDPVGGGYVLF
jgi:hypothetical protein